MTLHWLPHNIQTKTSTISRTDNVHVWEVSVAWLELQILGKEIVQNVNQVEQLSGIYSVLLHMEQYCHLCSFYLAPASIKHSI